MWPVAATADGESREAAAVRGRSRGCIMMMGARRVRVALCQLQSALGDEHTDPRPENTERGIAALRQAAERGAQLAVFGEIYLNGYRTDEYLYKYGVTVDPPDEYLSRFLDAARDLNIHVILGAATYGPAVPGDLYNSAIFLGPSGVIGVHHKAHVAAFAHSTGVANERCFYSPGKALEVFESPVGRIGIEICYDMSFPETNRVLALKGSDLIVNVSASVHGFEEWWDHVMFARASDNEVWTLVCSVVGPQKGDVLFGGSKICAPSGKKVAEGKYNDEDLVIYDIDYDENLVARRRSHNFSVRQPRLYSPVSDPELAA